MKVMEIAIAQIGRGVESVYGKKCAKLRWLIDFQKQTVQNGYQFVNEEKPMYEEPDPIGDNGDPVKLGDLFIERAKKEVKDFKEVQRVMIEMDFATNTISKSTVVYTNTSGETKKYPNE